MHRHLKSRNPALNVPCRHEAVATDTVYSDTPVVDSGVKQAQLIVGKESLVSDIYPMRSGKQFVNTLEDNICRSRVISDSAKNEISHKVKDIPKAYNIKDWQSEPYHQNQNPAECWYRTIKAWANTIMNRTSAPDYCWLLTFQYVCYILNHVSTASLGGQVPLQVLYGVPPEISIMLFLPSISLYFMPPMISISLLKMRNVLPFGLILQNIVVIPLPTWFQMLIPLRSSATVLSGPGLSRILLKGLLNLEGRKIISLTPKPLNIQLLLQMLINQLSQISQLSS